MGQLVVAIGRQGLLLVFLFGQHHCLCFDVGTKCCQLGSKFKEAPYRFPNLPWLLAVLYDLKWPTNWALHLLLVWWIIDCLPVW